jgi:hypothetical protein
MEWVGGTLDGLEWKVGSKERSRVERDVSRWTGGVRPSIDVIRGTLLGAKGLHIKSRGLEPGEIVHD